MWRFLFSFIILFYSCSVEENQKDKGRVDNPLFERLPASATGLVFENLVQEQGDFDVFRYRNFYNGGGVGIADFNNDGLSDVYLTANMGPNKLFLNKGNLKFDDITETAGVKGSRMWSAGVSIADVNSDGYLDIYVCNAGDRFGGRRENELFINNGNLTFTESAAAYGLADNGFTTHAVFFDYDIDGDLDCYVLNNSFRPISTLGYKNLRDKRDAEGGDKLYRNDANRFVDVSEEAGIFGSVIGFGLGVSVGDINNDNLPDIYVSNDFYERDYLYINKGDGTFSEEIEKRMGHLSMYSMGADMGDLNNDGYPEIFSTDMLPADDYRLKTLSSFESYDVYQLRLANGYYHQFMRNMLHLNNKNGTFSEIGQMANVDATDWSWGALIVDLDNDMFKEIFISNGIFKDVTNLDFMEFFGSNEQIKAAMDGKKIDWKLFIEKMPSVKLSNYLFHRDSSWNYANLSEQWGLSEPSFSNGAAYGDLDNDGDYDLIVNNVNQELFVYQNRSRQLNGNNALTISLKGSGKNTFGVGTKVTGFIKGQKLSYDHVPMRGFQSSMDYRIVMGIGAAQSVDSLRLVWPDGRTQIIENVPANKHVVLDYSNATETGFERKLEETNLFSEIKSSEIKHVENKYNDFDRDRLLYHMLSTQGPAFATADLNNDGLDDFYLGGSIGDPGRVFIQEGEGSFREMKTNAFDSARDAEDVAAVFFDFDGDGDQDLYVVTGGSEHTTHSIATLDHLYENVGNKISSPAFVERKDALPRMFQSGSCVKPADFDGDGDLDLFVGTRQIPSYYGLPADQYLLINNGDGVFEDATMQIAPELRRFGMVTDASWFRFDDDEHPELLVVGEGVPITIFKNEKSKLVKIQVPGLEETAGFWNSLEPADIDQDGDIDFVLGNLGLNSRLSSIAGSHINLYVNDFDKNGSVEQIFSYVKSGKEYPMAYRPDLIKQMSSLKKQFVYYKDYAGKELGDIFAPELLTKAKKWTFKEFRSSILINNGGSFELVSLPDEAQRSPIFGVAVSDLNKDEKPDLLLGGNLFAVKPEIGRYDANQGVTLINGGQHTFRPVEATESGVEVLGETRHVATLRSTSGLLFAFVRNNDTIIFYRLN